MNVKFIGNMIHDLKDNIDCKNPFKIDLNFSSTIDWKFQ